MGSTWTRYSYGFVTLGFFVISLVGHWQFGWFAYVDEQNAHGQPIEVPSYQVGGLAFLLFLGSPQSKEDHDRIEAKIDEILRRVDPKSGDRKVSEIDDLYLGRDTDARHNRSRR